jgi:hypothetical protein
MTVPQNELSGLKWREPIEGLEFGETFLGGISSTYFARGLFSGYGFGFTNRRIIGFKARRTSLVAKITLTAPTLIVYLIATYEAFSQQLVLVGLLFPLILPVVDWANRIVTRRVSERIVSQEALTPSAILRQKKDFEISRTAIREISMQGPSRRWDQLGTGGTGYIQILTSDPQSGPVYVKISGKRHQIQYENLRDLIIKFGSPDPRVRAIEYQPS